MPRLALVGYILSCILAACGGPPKSESPVPARPVPVAIVVDTVLDGNIFGQPLRHPSGLAADAHGVLIVCDEGNNRIIRFTTDLKPEIEIGGRGSAAGLFNRPISAAIDGPLSIRVVDEGNKRICRLDSRLQYVDELSLSDPDDPLKFGAPGGVGVDKSGNIWVADRDNNRIAVFTLVQQFDRFVGEFGYAGGGLQSPEKLLVDRRGSHLICDAGNHRIAVYDEYGNFSRDLSDPELRDPAGFCVDDNDRVWVVDRFSARIFLFSSSGKRELLIEPSIPGLRVPLASPSDIAVVGDRIFISDSGNDRIVICSPLTDRE
jgi:sugar lactone lactonase YvrE